jgi:hypothetical protein
MILARLRLPAAAPWRWSAAAPSPISTPSGAGLRLPLAGQHGLERRDGGPDAPDARRRGCCPSSRRWRDPAAHPGSAGRGQGLDAGRALPAASRRLAPWLHRSLRALIVARCRPQSFPAARQARDRAASLAGATRAGDRRLLRRGAVQGPAAGVHRRRRHRRTRLPHGQCGARHFGQSRRWKPRRPAIACPTWRRCAPGWKHAGGGCRGEERHERIARSGADRQLHRRRPARRAGRIVWGCFPRFDGDPVFCSLLRRTRRLRLLRRRPGRLSHAEQAYLDQHRDPASPACTTARRRVEITDFAPRFRLTAACSGR